MDLASLCNIEPISKAKQVKKMQADDRNLQDLQVFGDT
jgi:hypothetical protein